MIKAKFRFEILLYELLRFDRLQPPVQTMHRLMYLALTYYLYIHSMNSIACEQAPKGASAEQSFGAKRRAIGACTHSPKSPMPPRRNYLVSCQISTNQHTPEVKVQNKSEQIMIHVKAWCVRHVSQRNSKKVICG